MFSFENRKLTSSIFCGLCLAALIIIFIIAKVNGDAYFLQSGYLVSALVCVLFIFLRLTQFNRLISQGFIDSRSFRGSEQHNTMRFENVLSILAAAIFIGCAFLFKLFL